METTDFIDVMTEAAGEAGVDADNISTQEFATWRRFAKRRLETAWRYHLWPDLSRCEQRFYRLAWSATTTYSQATAGVDNAANEVWWALTGQYFVSLQNGNLNNPPTSANGTPDLAHWAFTAQFSIQPFPAGTLPSWPDNPPFPVPWVNVQPWNSTGTYNQGDRVQYAGNVYQLFATGPVTGILPTDTTNWGLVPPFDAYVPYEQTGQTAFTVVEGVFSANPRTTTRGNEVNMFLSERGIEVLTPIAAVWVQYRIRCPKLNGSNYSSTTAYASGAQFYYSSNTLPGNFYTVGTGGSNAGDTPDSAPGKFTVVALPRMFHRYLVLGMAADWSKYVTGTNPEAEPQSTLAEQLAEQELDDVKSLYVGQMGQRVKTQVRTR